jgi:hypothetical protein
LSARLALSAAIVLVAGVAHAGSVLELSQTQEPIVEPHHWPQDEARAFFALRFDTGYLYLKPRMSFGWGRPFTSWGGLDVVPFVTPDSTGGYAGLRLQIQWLEIRAGARAVHSFARQYLPQQPTYNLIDLSEDHGRPSNYLGLEAEATAAIPAGPGAILALFTASSLQFVPPMSNVFDETLRVVVNPPAVYRGRLGYSLALGKEKVGRIGLVGEMIEIPDRSAQVWRVGLIASFDIDDHLQLFANVIVPVVTPDSLGLLGADYTEIGLRWRWSTGHKHVARDRIPGSSS